MSPADEFLQLSKLPVSGHTGAAHQSPVLLGHGSRDLSTPLPPQLPLPEVRMAGEVTTEENLHFPSSKNLSQLYQVRCKQEQPPIYPLFKLQGLHHGLPQR